MSDSYLYGKCSNLDISSKYCFHFLQSQCSICRQNIKFLHCRGIDKCKLHRCKTQNAGDEIFPIL